MYCGIRDLDGSWIWMDLVYMVRVWLRRLNVSMDQFIDFCILCGCDYCDTLKGIGQGPRQSADQKVRDMHMLDIM